MRVATHVSVYLDELRSTCCVYEDGAPILDVSTSSTVLALSVPDRDAVSDVDVAAARGLLVAVRQYAQDMERVHLEQQTRRGVEAVA